MRHLSNDAHSPAAKVPWNKGKIIGARPPLQTKHVWSIRTKLQMDSKTRDLAMFNVAIDSKLRGRDVGFARNARHRPTSAGEHQRLIDQRLMEAMITIARYGRTTRPRPQRAVE